MEQEDIFQENKKPIFVDYSASVDNRTDPNNKKKKIITITAIVLVALIVMSSMFVVGYFSGKKASMDADMPLLVEAYELVKKYYYEDIDWETFQVIAAEQFFSSVDDFTFMSEYDYTTASIALGMNISSTIYNEHKIEYIVPSSPVELASSNKKYETNDFSGLGTTVEDPVKIEIGDKIYAISINNLAPTKVEGASAALLSAFISKSDDVILYIQKSNGYDAYYSGYYEFSLTKDLIVSKQAFYFDSEQINDPTNSTSMIKLSAFQKTAVKDFSECIDKFIDSGNTNLILDLRSNGGGDSQILGFISACLLQGADSTDLKLAKYVYNTGNGIFDETFFTTQHSYTDDDGNEYTAKNLPALINNFKVTILCNGGSASCSEVLIGALMHYNQSQIVGSKTYGKGVGQTVRPLSDGEHYVHITNGKYYIPTYENEVEVWTTSIHGEGFTPEAVNKIPTSSVRPYKTDLYIQRALTLLTA